MHLNIDGWQTKAVFQERSLTIANNKYLFPTQQCQRDFIIKQSNHLQGWKHKTGLVPMQFLLSLLRLPDNLQKPGWWGLFGHPPCGSWTKTKITFCVVRKTQLLLSRCILERVDLWDKGCYLLLTCFQILKSKFPEFRDDLLLKNIPQCTKCKHSSRDWSSPSSGGSTLDN